MNRIEFMTELAALLQDVPVEERKEAMQYYNDYFDDAGEEEKDVVKELGSPEKVAENIKKDLGIQTEIASGGTQNTGANHTGAQDAGAQNNGTQNVGTQEQSNHIWKIVLIVLVVIFGLPLLLGIGGGVLGLLAGIIATVFSVILTAVLVVVSGVLAVVSGIALLIAEPAVGLALIGGGLIAGVCGVIASVLLVKLCMIAFPAAGRWITKMWNKVKNRKKVA
ncbi:DUF1700 domain-containing protein [Dorea sp. ICN-14282]|uniref:DUF1700 domain-containing protein n=1 Tax=Dorea sp. ICN-14282 TaxID=3134654 RepID=UPI0030BA7F10